MAAELKLVHPHTKVTLVHSRDKLLSSEDLTEECKDRALQLVKEADVEVLLGHRVASSNQVTTTDGYKKLEIEFTNGSKMFASEMIMAISKPETTATYLPKEALDEQGFVKINAK
jgi:thioredoxin reductase